MKARINTIVGGVLLLHLLTPTEVSAHWPDGHLGFWGETWHAVEHLVEGAAGMVMLTGVVIVLLVATLLKGLRRETGKPNSDSGVG